MSILSETNYQLTLSRAWSGITLWSKGGAIMAQIDSSNPQAGRRNPKAQN